MQNPQRQQYDALLFSYNRLSEEHARLVGKHNELVAAFNSLLSERGRWQEERGKAVRAIRNLRAENERLARAAAYAPPAPRAGMPAQAGFPDGSPGAAASGNRDLVDERDRLEKEIRRLRREVSALDGEVFAQGFGLYEPTYGFARASDYKERLDGVRARQKAIVKDAQRAAGKGHWKLNGSESAGRKMAKDICRLAYKLFNSDCDAIIGKATSSNIDEVHARIDRSHEDINALVAVFDVSIPEQYAGLKHDEAVLAYEHSIAKERERELLREERERQKEERKAQAEIRKRKQELEDERRKIEGERARLQERIAADPRDAAAISKLEALDAEIREVDRGIADTDYREANKRAGYVYIISNIGSFGKDVYKIGMTRRLDPMERIQELSGASVPFKFDVHALIFTEDAPGLEAALHNRFASAKVNKVNPHKEFFRCTLAEIEDAVRSTYDKTVEFTEEAEAEEWRMSEAMRSRDMAAGGPAPTGGGMPGGAGGVM